MMRWSNLLAVLFAVGGGVGCPSLILGPDAVMIDANIEVQLSGLEQGDEVDFRLGPQRRRFVAEADQSTADLFMALEVGEHDGRLNRRDDEDRCIRFDLELEDEQQVEVLSFDYRFLPEDCDGGDGDGDSGDGDGDSGDGDGDSGDGDGDSGDGDGDGDGDSSGPGDGDSS